MLACNLFALMRQALDASCESMRIETFRRRPCCRAGKIARHARGRALKLCDARAARRLSDAIGMIRAMALAPQPPETQKKHRAHDKKIGCVPARLGLSLIFRPGSAPPPFSPAKPARHRRRERRNSPAPRIQAKIRPKKISNADFGFLPRLRCRHPVATRLKPACVMLQRDGNPLFFLPRLEFSPARYEFSSNRNKRLRRQFLRRRLTQNDIQRF